MRRSVIPRSLLLVALVVSSLCAAPACGDTGLTRVEAKAVVDAYLASQIDVTRDIPVGQGLHIATEKAMDFGAPIRFDMFGLYQELEIRGLIVMVDRGGLQGFASEVRTFDVTLTDKGAEVLGPVHEGKPDYGRGPSVYPIPPSYACVLICRKAVHAITGIRIVEPDVAVEVEYTWHCTDASPIADLVKATKKEYPRAPAALTTEGSGSVRLALYDDGWRVKRTP